MDEATTDRCQSCGLLFEDDRPQCWRLFDEVLAQHFSNPAYGRVHRLFVDTYCLQHPDHGCISFKSFAAHATHACWSLERGGNQALPSEHIRRWVERHDYLEKPPLPMYRGSLTIADVLCARAPADRQQAVEAWARDVWEAYKDLQPTIRHWLDLATGDDVGESRIAPSPGSGRKRTQGGQASG